MSIAQQLQQKQCIGQIRQPRKDSLIKTESSQSGDDKKDLSGNIEEENKIEQLQNKYSQVLKENLAEDIQANKEKESTEGALKNGKVSLKSSLVGARQTKFNDSSKKVTFKQELCEIIGKDSKEGESQEDESNSENQYYPSQKAKETHKKDAKRVQKDLEKQRKQFEEIESKRKQKQAFPQNYNVISKILESGNEIIKEEVPEQQQDIDEKIPKKQKKQEKNGTKKAEKVEKMNENKIKNEQIIHTNKEIEGDDSKKDNNCCVNNEIQQNGTDKIGEEINTSNESSVNSQESSPQKVKSARLVQKQELKTLSSSLTNDEKKLENNFKKKYQKERKAEEKTDSINNQLGEGQDKEPEICKKQKKTQQTNKKKLKLINDIEMNQAGLVPQMKKHSKDKFRKKVGEKIKDEELNPDYIDPSLRFINKKHFFQCVFDKFRPSGRKQFLLEINQAALNEPVGKITDPTLVLKIFHSVYDQQKQVTQDNTEHKNGKEQEQQNGNEKEDTIESDESPSKQQQNIEVISNPVQAIQQIQKDNDEVYAMNYPSATYLNSDLRYLNFDVLLQKVKSFDIVYMDPPWRIKGGQMYDSQFMFSNNKFSLEYDTMSNKEIGDIQVEKLSKKGFMFLWILNTQLESASIIMQKWGYTVIDKIIWIKMKSSDRISLTHGYYFMHSFEMCVVGYKDTTTRTQPSGAVSPEGSDLSSFKVPEFYQGIANNVIFAEVRKKSQKPDEFYELMELLVPGAKKIELFARNNNIRPGWISIGNQLGENYEKWKDSVRCDICRQTIEKGRHRYKSKREKDFDVCNDCFKERELDKRDFFFIENNVSEDVLHEYQMCNHCKIEPIWGIKFECKVCKDYDLCEACIDLNIASNPQFHDITHDMNLIEVPLYASGFQAHDRKCIGCYRSPILGPCVTCFECNGAYNLCQKCYFSKPMREMLHKNHMEFHTMQIIITPIFNESKKKKKIFPCVSCRQQSKEDTMFKCENCFNFYMCLECMAEKGKDMKAFTQNTHKPYHKLVQVSVQQELKNLREPPPQVHNQTNQEDMFSEDSLYEEYDENGEVIKHAKVEDTLKIITEEEKVDKKDNELEEDENSKNIEQMEGNNKENKPENHNQDENNDVTSNGRKSSTQEMIIEAQKAGELICNSTKKKVSLEEINLTPAAEAETILQFKAQCVSANKSEDHPSDGQKGNEISINLDNENDELSQKTTLSVLKQSKSITKTDKNLSTLPKRGRGRPKKQQNPREINNPEDTINEDINERI